VPQVSRVLQVAAGFSLRKEAYLDRITMNVREKIHRLPKEFYKGEVAVAFTLCLKGDVTAGFSLHPEIVNIFIDTLAIVVRNTNCCVPVYCFMPDHQHLIIMGEKSDSDIWKAIAGYKQKTGFWMSENKFGIKWQKGFYDHVIKKHVDLVSQVKYILDNPVRKGIVSSWQEYPFKGAIGRMC
jgi:REP element-mobilizing transposase RayT